MNGIAERCWHIALPLERQKQPPIGKRAQCLCASARLEVKVSQTLMLSSVACDAAPASISG